MSNVVDDRVVKMKFDNEQFEDGVKDTMRSLDDLDKNLKNLDKTNFGGGLGDALNGIGGAVDDLAERFDGWGVFVKRIIENVADAAYEQGMKIVKSLSTDNIMAGWQKYEDLSSNIYAILNQVNHGETYEDVTRAIEKLSWYSDATSFSLSDMTSALKGFISQGIDLNTATAMIMGMGNSITYAGAGAKEGSGAFQVFAKAMGQGYIGLKQWQQLSSTYGVATYGLKEQALDTAEALGKFKSVTVKDGEKIYETFEGLTFTIDEFDTTLGNQKGKWFDKDVMQALYGDTGAYGDYISGLAEYIQYVKETTGRQLTWNEAVEEYGEVLGRDLTEQEEFGKVAADSATVAKTLTEAIDAVKDAVSSSWQRIFQSMFGDIEKAKEVWSEFSDFLNEIFGSPMATLANYMEAWSKLPLEMGGRDSFLNIFRNLSGAVGSYLNPITKAWEVIHGTKTFDDIVAKIGETVKRVEEFTSKLKMSEETSAKFQRVWEVIFEVLKTAHEGLKKIWGLFKAAGSVVAPVIKLLGGVAYAIAEIVDVIFKVFNLDGNLWGWLNGPTNALKALGAKLNDVVSIFTIGKDTIEEGGTRAFTGAANAADKLTESARGLTGTITDLWDNFKTTEGYEAFKANLDKVKENLKAWNSSFLDNFKKTYADNGKGIKGTILAAYNGVKDGVIELYNSLTILLDGHFASVTDKIRKFAAWIETTVGTIGNGIKSLASKAYSSIVGTESPMDQLFGDPAAAEGDANAQMNILEKYRKKVQEDASTTLLSSKLMSKSHQIFASLFNVSMVYQIEKIMKNISDMVAAAKDTFGSIGGTFDQLTKSLKTMQTQLKADILKSIAAAVLALAGAMFVLAMIPKEQMSNALGVLSVLIVEMGGFVAAMSKLDFQRSGAVLNGGTKKLSIASSGVSSLATEMLGLSASMILLATALAKIGAIPEEELKRGMGAVTALMIELGAFAKFTTTNKDSLGGLQGNAGMQVFKMASGLIVMAQAMKMLADLDDEKNSLGKGLGAVGGILTMLFTFDAAMNKWGGKDMGDMSQIITMAAGLAALAIVIKGFAAIPTNELIKGGVSIGACLTAVGVFMHAMTEAKVSGGEMAKISGAMIVFGIALGTMAGSLVVMNLVQWDSLGKAAIVIAGFAGAAILLEGATSALIGFGVAVAAFGIGIAGIGTGLLAFATAMTIVGVEAPLFVMGLIETIRALLLGIISLKAEIAGAIIALIDAACEAIVGSVDTILNAIGVLALAVIDWVISMILQIGDIIEKNGPMLKERAAQLFGALLDALKFVIPAILRAFLGLLGDFGNYIIAHWPEMKEKAKEMLIKFKDGIVEGAEIALLKFAYLMVAIICAIKAKYAEIKERARELIDNIKQGIEEKWDSIKKAASDTVSNFIQGIKDKFSDLLAIGADIFAKVKEGLRTAFEAPMTGIKNLATNLLNGFKTGLDDTTTQNSLLAKVGGIGSKILNKFKDVLGIASPSKETEALAKFLMEGFVKGIDKTSFRAEEEAKLAAENILEAFGDPLAEMVAKLEKEVEMNPTITPVIDLSEFAIGIEGMQKGYETVQDMVDSAKKKYDKQQYWDWYNKYVKGEVDLDAEHATWVSHDEHVNGKKHTVTVGSQTTMDMIAAAASGMMTAEARKIWEENATEADVHQAVKLYQINQNITSPKYLDTVEIYRMMTNGMKDVSAKDAAMNKALTSYYNKPSSSAVPIINS